MFRSLSELSNVVSVVLYAWEDNSFLLTVDPQSKELWIPSTKVGEQECAWRVLARKFVKQTYQFEPESEELLKVVKVWQPKPFRELMHTIFRINVPSEVKKKLLKKPNIRWVQGDEISTKSVIENLKSAEIIQLFGIVRGQLKPPKYSESPLVSFPDGPWEALLEDNLLSTFTEVCENHLLLVPERKGSAATNEGLIEAASLSKKDQENLLREFLLHSFPCVYMSKTAFAKFITQVGWSTEEAQNLFRSADIYGRSSLSFRDFLYVIAALEPMTSHAGAAAEIRCRYIYRFFTKRQGDGMDFEDFTKLITALQKCKNQATNAASVSQEAEKVIKSMNLTPQSTINMNAFLLAVGSLKIRGASSLLRSPKSAITTVKETQEASDKQSQKQGIQAAPIIGDSLGGGPVHKRGEYDFAVHSIKLKKTGISFQNICKFWSLEGSVSKSSSNVSKTQLLRPLSVTTFTKNFPPNEILRGLGYFSEGTVDSKGKRKEPFTWGKIDPAGFGKALVTICEMVCDVFRQEPRLLELTSPVFVLGDLHGNFPDLINFEKTLWGLGPTLTPSCFLFLGDYVDRGAFSVEVIAYLFAYKVQNPKRIWLLRGNHEIREVQLRYTFLKEATTKFGENLGKQVWQSVNLAFDALPLAAVIDERIFCAHGGIPPPWSCPVVSAINSIPCPLPRPDEQSLLAWELMWNDPIKKDVMDEDLSMELLANSGFAANRKRGTAHIFDVHALEKFLLVNGFTHVIRAHEVQQAGFKIEQNGKLVTVFSSSHYCGATNSAACALCYHSVIRFFQLDSADL